MRAAMFQTPFMAPERSAREVFAWAVDQAVAADQAGLTEYWIGEHASQSWECIPNPEMVIAAAALHTENIKLAPGAHILPYHNPASTAIQIAWLSQILEGRYLLGVGAGAYPADGYIRGRKDLSQNHEMLVEAIDILQRIWRGEPFFYEGKFWSAGMPEEDPGHPFRKMTPPSEIQMGITGFSPNSTSMRFAGEYGFLPLSIYCGDQFVQNHWATFSEAANVAGHQVDHSCHHVVRDVLVADTDAEAKRLAIEGGMGRAWSEYLLPIYSRFGILEGLVKHPGKSASDIDLNYLAEHVWLVGSPDTVVEKFDEFQAGTGGFGTVMAYGHDYIDNAAAWNESLRLLAQEVAPRVASGPSGDGTIVRAATGQASTKG